MVVGLELGKRCMWWDMGQSGVSWVGSLNKL